MCEKAMEGFLKSIERLSKMQLSEEQKFDQLYVFPTLYLPSDANKLEISANLTIIDEPELAKRLDNVHHEHIKFVKNAHTSFIRHKLLLALPEIFRPKCVSAQVREVVVVVAPCESVPDVKALNKKFRMDVFVDGLSDILARSDTLGEHGKNQYRQKFLELQFQQVANLETILVWQSSNDEVQGTNKLREVFYDRDKSMVYLKIDPNLCTMTRRIRDLAFDAIVECTNGLAKQYRLEISSLLECDNVEEMNEALSRFNVSVESTWEPELGTYVPHDLYDYLELSIQDLKPGEIVALEVLNPGLDGVTDYAYKYVKVVKRRSVNNVPCYDINDGTNVWCEIAYKLYRFVPSNEISREIERYTDLQGEAYQHKNVFDFHKNYFFLMLDRKSVV